MAGLEIGISFVMILTVYALLLPFTPSHYAVVLACLLYPIGFIYGETTLIEYLRFLLLALFGNTIDSVVFVTVLKARALEDDIENFKEYHGMSGGVISIEPIIVTGLFDSLPLE